MEVKNQIVTSQSNKQPSFSEVINTPTYQALLRNSISDEKRRARFVTGVIAAVSNNPTLASDCTASSVVSAALQGEALGLSPSPTLGEYYIVPYKNKKSDGQGKAAFQIGVNGLKQLAMRTGLYRDLDAIEIREGEYKGRDKETGKPIFEFIEDDEVRENLPIIGYLAYYELLNGFRRRVYFSEEKVVNWANKYSPSFKKETWQRYKDDKITDSYEKTKLDGIHWYGNHTAMGLKTVMRQLLKDAPKSIEMNDALIKDSENEKDISAAVPENVSDLFFSSENVPEKAESDNGETLTVIVDEMPLPEESKKAAVKTSRGKKNAENELFGD